MKGIYTTWTLQDLTLCIISVVFCYTQGSVTTSNQVVELGGNVTLNCTSLQNSNIYQITWAKKENGNDENIATYTKNIGPTVLKYKDRINFIVRNLQDTAINLSNVSTEDNGCYKCSFLGYPVGPDIGEPCLSVYDNLKTSTDYNISDNHLLANCLATGFPRPNISWFPPEGEKKEMGITNPNGTLSVISNISLSKSNVKQGLICHVTHRGKTISIEVLKKEIDHTKKTFLVLPVVLALILVILVIIVIVCCWRRQRKKRRAL